MGCHSNGPIIVYKNVLFLKEHYQFSVVIKEGTKTVSPGQIIVKLVGIILGREGNNVIQRVFGMLVVLQQE